MVPDHEGTWQKLQEMTVEWRKLSHHQLLPHRLHQAVLYFFGQRVKDAGGPIISAGEAVLAKLLAKEIKFLITSEASDHRIASTFGAEGHWLDRAFLNLLRSADEHATSDFFTAVSNSATKTKQLFENRGTLAL